MIEIEGILYEPIQQNRPQRGGVKTLLLMTAALGLASMGINSYSRPRPNVDIVEEYKLILQKKSDLSKRDRDWVVWQFKRNFKRVYPPKDE